MKMQEIKKEFSNKNILLTLTAIALVGIIFRLIFLPFNLPVLYDALGYFWYGIDMSIVSQFPLGHDLTNNLWPSILGIMFSSINSDNFLDYSNAQRILSSIVSVITIIPIFFLCNRFVDKKLAVLGSALFILDPRIIHNSILGITEPLFVLMGVTTIFLFLSDNKKIIYLSFATAAIFSLVRYEGILIIIPMTVIFLFRFRKDRKMIFQYLIAIGIFILILTPMVIVKQQTMGYDGLISHVGSGVEVAVTSNELNEDVDQRKFFPLLGITNLFKYLGWILVPNLILFLPLGIILFLKKRDIKKKSLLLIGIISLIPAFYACSRGILDTRYLLIIYPILIIFSLYAINWIGEKTHRRDLIIVIIFVGISISSVAFLDIKMDNEHEIEAFEIALKNSPQLSVINSYETESTYYRSTVIAEMKEFPILKDEVNRKISILSTNDVNSIEDLLIINEKKKLKHIIIDNAAERPEFLKEIFTNEEKLPYLKKIYDSKIDGYNYHLKIFEINYNQFNDLRN
jgi:hypothetical protein